MKKFFIIGSCALMLCLLASTLCAAYELIDLGTLGGYSAVAYDIDDSGRIVGIADTPDGYYHAFLWDNGTMADLGVLDGYSSYAQAVNNLGEVAGYADTVDWDIHAVLWKEGSALDLGALGGWYSAANDVNDSGTVVGAYYNEYSEYHAAKWSEGSATDLGTLGGYSSQALGVNNEGWIVGDSTTSEDEWRAVMWNDTGINDLGFTGTARAINDLRQITGIAYDPELGYRAFLYENGNLQNLGTLGGSYSTASDINNAGQVVGVASLATNVTHACLWENGTAADINSLIQPDSGWELIEATAINNHGDIVGWGIFESQIRSFVLASQRAVQVQIDIIPNSEKNRIKLKDKGSIPVAILATALAGGQDWFDPATVDPSTVTMEGAPADQNKKGEYLTKLTDVNSDGRLDLIVWINISDLQLQTGAVAVRLEGATLGGQEIYGEDQVEIFDKKKPK